MMWKLIKKKIRKDKIYKWFNVVIYKELTERNEIVTVDKERKKKSQVYTISYLPAVVGCWCAKGALEYLLGDSKN